MTADHEQQKQRDHEDSAQVSLWWLLCSILLSSLVLAVFEPMFLLVAGGCGLAIPFLSSRDAAQAAEQARLLEQLEHEAEHARQRNRLLRAILDSADIPLMVTDADGVLIFINSHSETDLGIGQNMLGRRFDELLVQTQLHALEESARGATAGHARASILTGGEMRDFEVSGDPVEVSGGAVMTFRDITELSRAIRLKADFVANASHELRTPIASIKGAIETLSGAARHDEPMADRLIEMILGNADRLGLLASDLLDLSKLEDGQRAAQIEPINVEALIGRVFDQHRMPSTQRGIELVSEVEKTESEILSDPTLLGLILNNLVENAIKFAREDTRVLVRVRRADIEPERGVPLADGLVGRDGVEISVIDRGIGIPLNQQQRVFERFYQVDEARSGSGIKRGTGLGLAIVKHAARRLGGSVSLTSVYQSGTTMSVRLPRCLAVSIVDSDAESGGFESP